MIELRPLLFQIQNRKDVLDMVAMKALQQTCLDVFRKTKCWRVDVTGTMSIGSPIITPAVPAQTVGTETQIVEAIGIHRMEAQNGTIWYSLIERAAVNSEADRNSVLLNGMPRKWTERFGKAFLDMIPDQAYGYKARVAIAPTDHFEVVELPRTPEIELMLIEGAMSQLWEFGEKANPQMADRARSKFLMHLQNFGADVLVTGGQAFIPPTALTPRRWR